MMTHLKFLKFFLGKKGWGMAIKELGSCKHKKVDKKA